MILKPRPAEWFELLTTREALASALKCLAGTGAVELECHSETARPLLPADFSRVLDDYDLLARRYSGYWPRRAPAAPASERRDPSVILEEAHLALKQWVEEAKPEIEALQAVEGEQTDLRLLLEFVSKSERPVAALDRMAQAGPVLAASVFLLANDNSIEVAPPAVITQRLRAGDHYFLVAVGPAAHMEALREHLLDLKARSLKLPAGLPRDPHEAAAALRARLAEIEEEIPRRRRTLEGINQARELSRVLGDFRLLRWWAAHVPAMPATERLAWVTGWTSEPDAKGVRGCLDSTGIPYLLRLPEAPVGSQSPMVLRNPFWARPFELFPRLMGVPGGNEVDPSALVGVLAPLMFGYMFGDVGHGAVLLAAGLVLRRRWPVVAILVPGGIMSMIFGWLFGSVFAVEHVISPLWLAPMNQPIPVLLWPMVLGAAIIFTGLVFDALQEHWIGKGGQWWRTKAGILLAYLGLIGATGDVRSLAAVAVGALWYITGACWQSKRIARLASAVGEVLEQFMQLLVNTISFVRVGAFALAHAGLGAAVTGLAQAGEAAWTFYLIMILGNVLIIALEGLVASIQTTRLILFEFFVRFLRTSGRAFHPLPEPKETVSDRNNHRSAL
jgi:V/A-type H+-transporting ATPase subunit I